MSLLKELYESSTPAKVKQSPKVTQKTLDEPKVKKPVKKTKVAESKKLSKTLLHDMLENVNALSGIDHLKDAVGRESAHRRFMHLQSAENLSSEERDELNAINDSKRKILPDPDKHIQFNIHKAEVQRDHYQHHLDRAVEKLQNPETSEHIRDMVQHITIPEMEKLIAKTNSKIEKLHQQLEAHI